MIVAVHIFGGGEATHLERVMDRGGAWRLRTVPARFAAIEHATEGLILFDTGFHPSLRDRMRGLARAYHHVVPWRCEVGTAEALRRAGLDPAQVSRVVLSHLHVDHLAGVPDFPEATLHLSRVAWDHLRSGSRVALARKGFFPELLPESVLPRIEWVEPPPPSEALDQSALDLLGDGTIGVVGLPGHAPGQLGLVVRPPEGPRTFLVADATFGLDALRRGDLPSRAFRAAVFHSDADTRATLSHMRRWWQAEPDLRVVPAHAWEDLDQGFTR